MRNNDYQLTKLPSGLRVLTVPMPKRASSAVAIWVKTGGRFENKQNSGVSHFLEHMLFKGTRKRNNRQIKEEIEGVGGLLNAFTGEEATCYFAKLLKQFYPRALDVLSDMILNATVSAREFEKERGVILEEIKMYRDLPSHYVHDLMGQLLWSNQPLGRPLAGTPETVTKMRHADMRGYKKRYYHPKNILVSVSGNLDHEEVLERVFKIYPKDGTSRLSSYTAADSRQNKAKTMFCEKQTEQTHFVVGFHGLSRNHPDRYKLSLLHVILGVNMSSRLFEELREKRGLAYEIKSGIIAYQDAGAFLVSAGVETQKTDRALAVILKELVKIRKTHVKKGELRRAKDYFMSQIDMGVEDTLDHLLWAGEKVLSRNEVPDIDEIKARIEAVTEDDIKQMAKKVFRTNNLNLALIGPLPKKAQEKIKKDFFIEGT